MKDLGGAEQVEAALCLARRVARWWQRFDGGGAAQKRGSSLQWGMVGGGGHRAQLYRSGSSVARKAMTRGSLGLLAAAVVESERDTSEGGRRG